MLSGRDIAYVGKSKANVKRTKVIENRVRSKTVTASDSDQFWNTCMKRVYLFMIFKFQGTETSSLTLSFCFLMLAMHQDIQKDLYEELCTVTAGQNRMLTKEELAKCPLLERVIKESLRHVAPPVVPRITRHWLVLGKQLMNASMILKQTK